LLEGDQCDWRPSPKASDLGEHLAGGGGVVRLGQSGQWWLGPPGHGSSMPRWHLPLWCHASADSAPRATSDRRRFDRFIGPPFRPSSDGRRAARGSRCPTGSRAEPLRPTDSLGPPEPLAGCVTGLDCRTRLEEQVLAWIFRPVTRRARSCRGPRGLPSPRTAVRRRSWPGRLPLCWSQARKRWGGAVRGRPAATAHPPDWAAAAVGWPTRSACATSTGSPSPR
jgi:hypothetical protein